MTLASTGQSPMHPAADDNFEIQIKQFKQNLITTLKVWDKFL